VLVLELSFTEDDEDQHVESDPEGLLTFAGMVVSLDALARGAPALAALQLVLRLRDFDAGGFNMAMLWHALERVGRLSALTICMDFWNDVVEDFGELLAAQLDKVDARLPGVTDLCLATTSSGFNRQLGKEVALVSNCVCITCAYKLCFDSAYLDLPMNDSIAA